MRKYIDYVDKFLFVLMHSSLATGLIDIRDTTLFRVTMKRDCDSVTALCSVVRDFVLLCLAAAPSTVNEDRLCHDGVLHREEWPWIGKWCTGTLMM